MDLFQPSGARREFSPLFTFLRGSILPAEGNPWPLVWHFPLFLQPRFPPLSFRHLILHKNAHSSFFPGHGQYLLSSGFLLTFLCWESPPSLPAPRPRVPILLCFQSQAHPGLLAFPWRPATHSQRHVRTALPPKGLLPGHWCFRCSRPGPVPPSLV